MPDGPKGLDEARNINLKAEPGMYSSSGMSASLRVKRGRESWAYFYVALGFAVAIEGEIIQLITPLLFPWNLVTFALLAAVTFYLFVFNDQFQDKLLGWKSRYEDSTQR
jgi:hypothetical protein